MMLKNLLGIDILYYVCVGVDIKCIIICLLFNLLLYGNCNYFYCKIGIVISIRIKIMRNL